LEGLLRAEESPGPEVYSFSRVVLPQVEEAELIKKIITAIQTKTFTKEMFLYKLIYQQFQVLESKSVRGIRWDPAIVSWFQSLKFVGGKRVIDLLRGERGDIQRGHSKQDTKNACLFGPSVATLKRKHIHSRAYEGLTEDKADIIAKISLQHNQGLLLFDEIEIRAGLEFAKDTNEIVGLMDNSISVKNIELDLNESDLPCFFAKYIFQVFFVSLDGTVCQPLCFFPTKKADYNFTIAKVEMIQKELALKGIEIIGTSSDGWAGSVPFSKELSNRVMWHVDDYAHALKRMRNSLLERKHITEQCPTGFSMRTLYGIWVKYAECLPDLTIDIIRPSDIMNMDSVLRLFKSIEPLQTLAGENPNTQLGSECFGLANYFHHMKLYVNAWEQSDRSFNNRFTDIQQVVISMPDWEYDDSK
jgi:hypothetical protein